MEGWVFLGVRIIDGVCLEVPGSPGDAIEDRQRSPKQCSLEEIWKQNMCDKTLDVYILVMMLIILGMKICFTVA